MPDDTPFEYLLAKSLNCIDNVQQWHDVENTDWSAVISCMQRASVTDIMRVQGALELHANQRAFAGVFVGVWGCVCGGGV
jgi:hypothetical protein